MFSAHENTQGREMRFIDLSVPLENSPFSPEPLKINYLSHERGAYLLGLKTLLAPTWRERFFRIINYLLGKNRITPADFPDGYALAWENFTSNTHSGTHLDSPYHFGKTVAGKLARTIDEIPLEWCFGQGVVLDLREKLPGEFITAVDLTKALEKINYRIKAGDIVLIQTGADRYWGTAEYLHRQPGCSAEAVHWLLDQGVKVIGIDAYTLDRPFEYMLADYQRTKDPGFLWPAHFVGREREYVHLEKLANLADLPGPSGFRLVCFPVNLRRASAGWCRVVAIIDS